MLKYSVLWNNDSSIKSTDIKGKMSVYEPPSIPKQSVNHVTVHNIGRSIIKTNIISI